MTDVFEYTNFPKMVLTRMVISLLLILSCTIIGEENNGDLFIPTKDWQVVRKGQKIPKGLHIRVNFETGVTEAKLLEDENKKMNTNNVVLEVSESDKDDKAGDKLLKTKFIKEALKKIKGDYASKGDEKNIKNKFRSYVQLKKEMSNLNLTPKIDAEVLKDIFKQHRKEVKKGKLDIYAVLRLIEDFDFLAHQFDNALEFVNQNGFKEIIYKNLNLSNTLIKEETLKLFGSLVQNNAKVQIHALETGSMAILLRILNLDSSVHVKSRAVHALSCLLRRFPLAQLRFVENGGLYVVQKVFEKEPVKVQVKLATLMSDLILEYLQASEDHPKDNHSSLLEQYRLINLKSLLLEQKWCISLDKLLYTLVMTDPDDHDSIEKCVLAMHSVADECADQFNKDILVGLQKRYKGLALNGSQISRNEFNNVDYFMNIHNLSGGVLQKKYMKTEL